MICFVLIERSLNLKKLHKLIVIFIGVVDKLRERKAQEVFDAARISENESTNKLVEEDVKRKAKYRLELKDQIIMKEQSKRQLYQEYLKEKKIIDDIIWSIQEEDER